MKKEGLNPFSLLPRHIISNRNASKQTLTSTSVQGKNGMSACVEHQLKY
jgi:hypothetical protein